MLFFSFKSASLLLLLLLSLALAFRKVQLSLSSSCVAVVRRCSYSLQCGAKSTDISPKSHRDSVQGSIKLVWNAVNTVLTSSAVLAAFKKASFADDSVIVDSSLDQLKVPYDHVNLPIRNFLGKKATIVFNMKIDDPQTVLQFPDLLEIYKKYSSKGLNVLAFPTEQGWFEPDDDETVRAKAKEQLGFGDYPNAVVFDKVDILGPSANPFYALLTKTLPTPNGYGRITLNYEKFLLDPQGRPVRRYPRKFSAYDFEADLQALLEDQPLPEESPQFLKAWREAKREALKSEYSFRYNYNYYTAPDSMYKYNPLNDQKKL